MLTNILLFLLGLGIGAQSADPALEAQARELRAIVEAAPELPLEGGEIPVMAPAPGWEMGMVSWVASDDAGHAYLLHRGDGADPIVAIDGDGRIVRSWGRGLYQTPHAIRVDPDGNIWTADAKSSMVIKFSPEGEKLMEIAVGGQPADCTGAFCGTTDVAFGPGGRIFIADGYRNARVLEYTADGRKVREWGRAGEGPGEFRLPHSIAVDGDVVYVADRENGRIQRFDLDGRYLGEWGKFGRTFGLFARDGSVWLATQQRDAPNLAIGWLMEIDAATGELAGYVEVAGVHGMTVLPNGELMVGPGPEAAHPQWFRRRR